MWPRAPSSTSENPRSSVTTFRNAKRSKAGQPQHRNDTQEASGKIVVPEPAVEPGPFSERAAPVVAEPDALARRRQGLQGGVRRRAALPSAASARVHVFEQ